MDYNLFKNTYDVIPIEYNVNSFNSCYSIIFNIVDKATSKSERLIMSNVYFKDLTNETQDQIILIAWDKVKDEILTYFNSLIDTSNIIKKPLQL